VGKVPTEEQTGVNSYETKCVLKKCGGTSGDDTREKKARRVGKEIDTTYEKRGGEHPKGSSLEEKCPRIMLLTRPPNRPATELDQESTKARTKGSLSWESKSWAS
jgi:hypothetical protein